MGPTLEDSEISFTGDDHLNILSRMLVVCKPLPSPNASVTATPCPAGDVCALAIIDLSGGGLGALLPGDEMEFYRLLPGKQLAANPLLGSGIVGAWPPARVTDAALLKVRDHGLGRWLWRPRSATPAARAHTAALLHSLCLLL